MHIPMRRSRPQPIGDRIRQGRLHLGLSQGQVSERTGLAQTSLSRYETGAANPSEPALRLLATIYGKPYEWFFGGGDLFPGHARPDTQAPDVASAPDLSDVRPTLDEMQQDALARLNRIEAAIQSMVSDYTPTAQSRPPVAIAEARAEYDDSGDPLARDPVDVIELAAAAGGGAEVFDETMVGRLWFRRDWLQRNAIDPTQCNVISVSGESMEPILPDGCSILVDRSQERRRRRDRRIFVMRTEDGLVVKRIEKDEEGQWQMVSEHKNWEPVPWKDDTEIIGEVRWSAVTY